LKYSITRQIAAKKTKTMGKSIFKLENRVFFKMIKNINIIKASIHESKVVGLLPFFGPVLR
jgi:hypothetical protein